MSPASDISNGRVKDFQIRISDDGKTWGEPLASGIWANNPVVKYVPLPLPLALASVQLRGLSEDRRSTVWA